MSSVKQNSMYELAAVEAAKSSSMYRLGAVIAKGRRVLCGGHNHDRTRMLGCYECHAHAEMDAAARYLRDQGVYEIPWDSLKVACVEGA